MLGGFFRAAGLGLQGYRLVGPGIQCRNGRKRATRQRKPMHFHLHNYAMADPRAIDGNLGTLRELTQWYTTAGRTHSSYPGPILVAAPALEGYPRAKTEKTPCGVKECGGRNRVQAHLAIS